MFCVVWTADSSGIYLSVLTHKQACLGVGVERLVNLVIANAMAVLFLGLLAGVMLVFSLLDAIALWPLPAIDVEFPGTTRGWQAAHVGGILNGVMIAGAALLMRHLEVEGKAASWIGYSMIVTGWGNTVFYWAGVFAANRGLSVGTTPYGAGDLAGALAYLGGGVAMFFTFIAVTWLGVIAWRKAS